MTDTVTLPAEPFHLAKGGHGSVFEGEACIRELGSIAAGRKFGDTTDNWSPIVGRLLMALNDRLDDDDRQRLLPYGYRAFGTEDDGREEERRQMCTEWLLHHALPDLLDRAGRKEAAQRLRDLAGDLAVEGVRQAIYDARSEAFAARAEAMKTLRTKIEAELKRRGIKAAAAAAAVAAAVAAAEAEAEAAAAAAAAAGAGAAAAAEAAAWKIRDEVYRAVRGKVREVVRPQSQEILTSALELVDRMLPPEPLVAPVIENADVIFGLRAA